MGAEDEEAVAGKDAFGEGGNEGAFAGAFDSTYLNAVARGEVQISEGGFAGDLRNGDRFHGGLVEMAADVSTGSARSAEKVLRIAELIAPAQEEEFVTGVKFFGPVGIGDHMALTIDGHDGAAESAAESKLRYAAAGVFSAKSQGDFVDLEVPFLRLFEDGSGQAGTGAERGSGFHTLSEIELELAVELDETAPEKGCKEKDDGGDDAKRPKGPEAERNEQQQPGEKDDSADGLECGLKKR